MSFNPFLTKVEQTKYDGSPGSVPLSSSKLGKMVQHRVALIRGNYKFSRDGGAQNATITLKDQFGENVTIPAGTVVWDGFTIAKSLTFGGATTLDFNAATANDLLAAGATTLFDGSNEISALIPVGTAAAAVFCATAVPFTMSINTSTVTGGELDVFLFCIYRE